ncbi:MAG: DUF6526 family protein [Acidobacteria bacterium]|nr:DUF6526 family protein [Acidobacteriota bacterium]
MERKPQSFANHAKLDPAFHFFLAPLLLILFVGAVRSALNEATGLAWWRAGMAFGLLLLMFKARIYALKVQDRLIRLEERLRLQRVLPAHQQELIDQITEQQLVALRFASDGELPELVERAVREKLPLKEIKQSIKSWRPDYFRV